MVSAKKNTEKKFSLPDVEYQEQITQNRWSAPQENTQRISESLWLQDPVSNKTKVTG